MSETDPTGVPAGDDETTVTPGHTTNAAPGGVAEDGSYIDSELEDDVAAPDTDEQGEYTDSDLT